MPNARPTPAATAEIISRLLKLGLLSEDAFRKMHHMRRSASKFQKYCNKHGQFISGSRNHQLAMKLREMLTDSQ